MVPCPKCGSDLGDPAPLACANCGYIFATQTPVPDADESAAGAPPVGGTGPPSAERACSNCRTALTPIGDLSFRVGGYQGGSEFLLGQWGQLAEKLQPFSLYHCPSCGKIELWESGR